MESLPRTAEKESRRHRASGQGASRGTQPQGARTHDYRDGNPRRRLFLGHAGPDPQPRRRLHARRLLRRRRAERDVSQPRHARRGDRDRLRSERISYRELLEFFFQIHDPTTLNRQGNDLGTSYRSAIFYTTTSRGASPRTRSPTSTPPASGPARSSPRSRPPARSGRPSRSIRTTSSTIRTATPATSSGPIGSCRSGPRKQPARQDGAAGCSGRSVTVVVDAAHCAWVPRRCPAEPLRRSWLVVDEHRPVCDGAARSALSPALDEQSNSSTAENEAASIVFLLPHQSGRAISCARSNA